MIDITNPTEVRKLGKAIDFAYTDQSVERERRNAMLRVYADMQREWYTSYFSDRFSKDAQYLPLFLQYVTGHIMSLGYTVPKWAVDAKQVDGKGFDKRIELLLESYFCILDGLKLTRQWALDSAFGDAVAKIVTGGMLPFGITSPVNPRAYRLDPNRVIRDRSADNVDNMGFVADLYLVSYKDAMNYEGFDPMVKQSLRPYKIETDDSKSTWTSRTTDAYPEEVCRLLDVYLPSSGVIFTVDAPNDAFLSITPELMLERREISINPYEFCRLVTLPDTVAEMSRLYMLRNLFFAADDLFAKGMHQTRSSKRNPIDKIGNEDDLNSLLNAPDNEAVFVNEPENIDLYTLPAADPALFQTSSLAAQQFSQQAGNMEVYLGLSPGADTARQTNAVMGQIQSAVEFSRSIFESFLSRVGQKLATLAFEDETLELTFQLQVPGTKYSYPVYWGPTHMLPRVGEIDDYHFEVVQYSTRYRSPQEKLTQLNQASMGIMQWFQAAGQGLPINMGAVIESFARAYDQVPNLTEWWSGEKPSPAEQTAQTYQSVMPHNPEGATVNYQGQGGGSSMAPLPPIEGGLQGA